MKHNINEAIIAKLVRLTHCIANPQEEVQGRVLLFISNNISFRLSGETLDLFEDIVKQLLQNVGFHEKYSEGYVRTALQGAIGEVCKEWDTTNARQYLKKLLADFVAYSENQTVYVPLAGIQMQLDQLKIGKVRLINMHESNMAQVLKKVDQVTNTGVAGAKDESAFIRNEFLENMNSQVCAEFNTIAEPERARQMAINEVRNVIDILRYAIPTLYHEDYKVAIGLKGEVLRISRWTSIFSEPDKDIQTQAELIGPIVPFLIDVTHIGFMTTIGVYKLSEILAKPSSEMNDFEKSLLRSVHWYSTSLTQFEDENQFLCLVTCLETLLTPKDGNPIGTSIAEGVALIVADDVQKRKHVKKRVKELYGLRSAISHGSEKAILKADLAELRAIATALVNKLINRCAEFKSRKDLLEWLESAKFGGA